MTDRCGQVFRAGDGGDYFLVVRGFTGELWHGVWLESLVGLTIGERRLAFLEEVGCRLC